MSGSTTPNYGFNLPAIGGNQDSWGNLLNANWTAADSAIHGLAAGYLPIGGGAITGNLQVNGTLGVLGNISTAGNLGAASVSTTGDVNAGGALSSGTGLSVGGTAGIAGGLTVGGNQGVTGSLTVGNSASVTGSVTASQSLYCQATGVHYTNVGANGFNFRWDSSNFFMRVDNAVEIAVQPQSDERLKGDIAPSTFDCLAAVLATPLFQFRWKNLGQHPNLETATVERDALLVPIGFVAQRQQAVFPASVIPGGDTGRSAGGATTMWQMDHNALCAALFGAVQQLAEMNKELAARVSDLEALRLA